MATQFQKTSGKINFVIVCVVSIALMIIDANTRWLDIPRNALSVVLSPIQTLASTPAVVGRFFDGALTSEPDVKIAYQNLRDEYFQLKAQTLLQRTLQEENEHLRLLLDASERLNETITLAELVNVSIDPYNHRVLIGRGLRNNVYVGQAVIDDRGVVGQVTEVMPLSSSIMLITDPGHALPVQVQRNGIRTVAYGTGNVSSLNIPFLNLNSDIKVGDILISSGLGGRFPNGYPVAEVDSVKIVEDEAFIQISATPIAKLDRSNHVLLLSREPIKKAIISQESELSKSASKLAHKEGDALLQNKSTLEKNEGEQ